MLDITQAWADLSTEMEDGGAGGFGGGGSEKKSPHLVAESMAAGAQARNGAQCAAKDVADVTSKVPCVDPNCVPQVCCAVSARLGFRVQGVGCRV